MKFVARINLPHNTPPARAYVHERGLKELYGPENPVEGAKTYLLDALHNHSATLDKFDFLLAVIWGYRCPGYGPDAKVANLLSYKFGSNVSGNADVRMWNIVNGELTPKIETIEDCIAIIGKEDEYRRTIHSILDYSRPPDLGIDGLREITIAPKHAH